MALVGCIKEMHSLLHKMYLDTNIQMNSVCVFDTPVENKFICAMWKKSNVKDLILIKL